MGDGGLKEVYFDFDQYELDTEDWAILRANAEWLKNIQQHALKSKVIPTNAAPMSTIWLLVPSERKRPNTI